MLRLDTEAQVKTLQDEGHSDCALHHGELVSYALTTAPAERDKRKVAVHLVGVLRAAATGFVALPLWLIGVGEGPVEAVGVVLIGVFPKLLQPTCKR